MYVCLLSHTVCSSLCDHEHGIWLLLCASNWHDVYSQQRNIIAIHCISVRINAEQLLCRAHESLCHYLGVHIYNYCVNK